MSEKPIAYQAYQQLADDYSAHIDTKPHNAFYDRPAMLSLLPDIQDKDVLDAGCGPGAYTSELVKRGARVVAIDISERMLELANERLQPAVSSGQVQFQQVDLTQPLDLFPDGRFDVVNAPLCLDYIEDWTRLFIEFRRVLKPGGTFLFSCGHPQFDAGYFNTNDYFSVERVQSVWTGFGQEILMPSFRRSFEHVLMPVIEAGLRITIAIVDTVPLGVDTPADLERARAWYAAQSAT